VHGVVSDDGDCRSRGLDRFAGPRIQGVGVARSLLLEGMPAVAGSGHRDAIERDHAGGAFIGICIGGVRIGCRFHQHLPCRAIRFSAVAVQFASDFDQRRGGTSIA
jgi:hypothetical protein